VWHSATKFIGGHHDLSAGVVAGRKDLITSIRQRQQRYGMTLGAMDAWLAMRGLQTLAPRMAWICETAASVAAYLSTHPAIAAVQYPGLPAHLDAALAQRLLPDGAGGILTCTLRGGPQVAEQVIRSLRLVSYALSFGGTTTTVCYPPTHACDDTADQARRYAPSETLRISIGLEAARDLIADLDQALAAHTEHCARQR
jgi:methionine-gamma-lyase